MKRESAITPIAFALVLLLTGLPAVAESTGPEVTVTLVRWPFT